MWEDIPKTLTAYLNTEDDYLGIIGSDWLLHVPFVVDLQIGRGLDFPNFLENFPKLLSILNGKFPKFPER